MEQEGTLRTSHRETHAVKRKPAKREVANAAKELVESCSRFGPIIRQRLDIERMKQPLQKGVFYVAENDGQADPGFLVFLPRQAPVFLQTRPKAPPPCTLRMRTSQVLGEGGGTILIATLDSVQHILRLEDVWMWRGEPIFDTKGYSARRAHLREFVERHWIPDARLMGGITTTVLNPVSLEAGIEGKGSAHTMDLIPEQAGRRRLWFQVETKAVAKMPSAEPLEKHAPPAEEVPVAPAPVQSGTATARPVDKMPDIYDIYDESGKPFGRASVQRFAVSQVLRDVKGAAKVRFEYRADFKGYEIVGVI
jgi:hypothetical protein